MAGKNFIYFAAVGAISSFVLFGKKKKPKAVCENIRTAEDFTRVMGSKSGVRFPASIVYYPDGVTADQAEVFCKLSVIKNITVIIVRASDYNRWSGENIQPGIVMMKSPSSGVFKSWDELLASV